VVLGDVYTSCQKQGLEGGPGQQRNKGGGSVSSLGCSTLRKKENRSPKKIKKSSGSFREAKRNTKTGKLQRGSPLGVESMKIRNKKKLLVGKEVLSRKSPKTLQSQ